MPSSHLMMEFLHGPGWTSILHRSTVPSEPGAGGAIVSKILTGLEVNPSPLQFIYSEKATKFEEISILVLTVHQLPTFGSGKNRVNQIWWFNEEYLCVSEICIKPIRANQGVVLMS